MRSVEAVAARPATGGDPGASPAIEARGVSRSFGGLVVLDGVDLRVRRGSVHGLIGPNGAGKSTLFNLLTRFLEPTRGTVWLDGVDITRLDPPAVARRGMVRSFQISSIFPDLSVQQNVRIALQQRTPLSYRFWKHPRCLHALHEEADRLLEAVGLLQHRLDRAVDLSYGRKRALELATTLALKPQVLLMDEPMAGLGHEDIDRVAELIRTAAAGRTVLMVEHNLKVVARLCERVTVLARGQVLAEGSYAEVARDAEVRRAYLGTADG